MADGRELPVPRPIFVLGKQRSGTTWLANQLCQHPMITGVRHEHHLGIDESAYFSSIYGRYGDLSEKQNFVEFVEVIGASDYFRLANATKDFLYALWPTTYEGLFLSVMNKFAEESGSAYWLEKSPNHTLMVGELAKMYPDARFVAVIRDVEEVVASTISRSQGGRSPLARTAAIIQTVISWSYFMKVICSFAYRSNRIFVIYHEEMRQDLGGMLSAVCDFLEIDFDEQVLCQAYRPNTSFRSDSGRKQALSSREKRLIELISNLSSATPLWALHGARKLRERLKGRSPLPSWFFSMSSFCQNSEVESEHV